MAQVFFARRAVIKSGEWEKAKMTIENIGRFKQNLKETVIYNNVEVYLVASRDLYPDFSTLEGFEATDSLRAIYISLFDDPNKMREDLFMTVDILDAFSYPIIMGYASEFGSFQSVIKDYYSYSAFVMPWAYRELTNIGFHAKLLNRLWRVRMELHFIPSMSTEYLNQHIHSLLCFEGTEITPATLKQYEKKLKKELKKIQKEIEEFKKSSLL